MQNEQDKTEYIENFRCTEGIKPERASISKNAGQRTLAKLKLNYMWCKWAQKQNDTQTTVVSSMQEFYKLMRSPNAQAAVTRYFASDTVTITMTEDGFKKHIIGLVSRNGLPLCLVSQQTLLV